jgi:hypothetical protein
MEHSRAGCLKQSTGYWYIKIDGCDYQSSRLAFFYMTGEWPVGEVDHINRKRADDRWDNLREATGSQNRVNRESNGNSTGFKGVTFDTKYLKPYIAKIQINGVSKYLGSFETAEEAHSVWYSAACTAFGKEFVEVL